MARGRSVSIIFDTDIGTDVDDAGALAILHILADQGKAEILATMSANQNRWCAPAIDVINTYYGRGDIPIGSSKTGPSPEDGSNQWIPGFPSNHSYLVYKMPQTELAAIIEDLLLTPPVP